MIDESLQEQAALYAAGVLSAREREQFDWILAHHCELRALVGELEAVTAAAVLSALPANAPRPSAGLKARILAMLPDHAQQPQNAAEGFVISGPDGLVKWVNPAFTEMCGYALEELCGKKLGPILQGEKTDLAVAERMRRAVHAHEPCRETILNYHKDGTPYWVQIEIQPIFDEDGAPKYMIAHEREVPEGELAA